MLIEPLESLTVKTPEGMRTLEPGKTYNLPALQAEKLLAKAPGKVRVVEPPAPTPEQATVKISDWVSYQVTPGDPEEGPFQVIEIVPDLRHGGWWVLVEKPGSMAWVHQRIVTSIEQPDQP